MVGVGRDAPVIGPRRGDIHLIVFPDTGGNVILGPHPAVVVQSDRMRRSSTTVVVPMTSRARAAELAPPFLVAASARESGLQRDGWIKCDQPLTIPSAALGPRLGRLAPEILEQVSEALRFTLDL